ncbi:DUF4301 family protein [Flavobacterium sp. NRK1]|uniref:DUF4301 family protein n=1 Tax=Flavobacterium sp. NRK1 TaxID=2954929 RepID=UPI0020938143|nr:DUF4301 family protein [Flavobacterium sp. NRK1]MCO6147213.1 DUF4301 family protein [Flavobacterium sp. NRK1]
MEGNITKQTTTAINITVYGNGLNGREFSEQLNSFTKPDSNSPYKFIFRTVSLTIAMNENDRSADLFIIKTTEQEENEAQKLAGHLKKNNRSFLVINSAPKSSFASECKTIISELKQALDNDFSINDFADIHKRGINVETILKQLDIFKNGIAKATLKKPALYNDGIFKLSEEKAIEYAALFDSKKENYKLTKFVPASGAATRMFKFLLEFITEYDPERETINGYINRKKENDLSVFLVGLEKFPFYKEIADIVAQQEGFDTWKKDQKLYAFIKTMLNGKVFDFANKPKGVLPFHDYGNFIATPIFEHLKEAVAYAASHNEANVHFTISEDHLDGFLDSIQEVKTDIENESGIPIKFGFSYQQKNTDTLAVNIDDTPFRDSENHLFFRPGGHGALIENLGKLDADIVFIKNIDNVSHNNIHTIALYKKALAGILIELQQQVFSYINRIDQEEISDESINDILTFAKDKLLQHIPSDVYKYALSYKKEFAKELLNKPIRICGMVKNEGEPGGGPFWIESSKGGLSLQIVESSQIDLENRSQKQIFANASHFNPVDLVCGLKNYKGEFFNLNEFIDNTSGFIVHKTRLGKQVKSYELPGLWNGAMAGWITVFAEVPLETFNPVKTVNDLLKPAHQP